MSTSINTTTSFNINSTSNRASTSISITTNFNTISVRTSTSFSIGNRAVAVAVAAAPPTTANKKAVDERSDLRVQAVLDEALDVLEDLSGQQHDRCRPVADLRSQTTAERGEERGTISATTANNNSTISGIKQHRSKSTRVTAPR